jgi:UDP-2,3-diacylglucosamine pyrophosphatase LpxH
MDLCFEAVGELLATGCDGMVCGHVHQARRYASLAPSRRMELLVLSAWGRRGAYVNLEGGELELRWFEGTVEACPIVGEG